MCHGTGVAPRILAVPRIVGRLQHWRNPTVAEPILDGYNHVRPRRKQLKVFLSWSGSRSHKVALVFREWLPSVIQDIVPYVSSEDIDKGARWSTDIAKELSNSQFGILCVTRENMNAPWLTFEAGALSKQVEKSFVNPFLFDIKRSELNGPLLQFQSTIFEKEDLKKLVVTLNKSCGDHGLTSDRLDKAFEVWYPTLKKELSEHAKSDSTNEDADLTTETQVSDTQKILEEILDLTRINQKLIRNPDNNIASILDELGTKFTSLHEQLKRKNNRESMRTIHRYDPMLLEELTHLSASFGDGNLGVKIVLSLFRHEYPWIYDSGLETLTILRSRKSMSEKRNAIERFRNIIDFSLSHPVMSEVFGGGKDMFYFNKMLQGRVIEAMERSL